MLTNTFDLCLNRHYENYLRSREKIHSLFSFPDSFAVRALRDVRAGVVARVCSATRSRALGPHLTHLVEGVGIAVLQACCAGKSVSSQRAWVCKALSTPQLLLSSLVEAKKEESSC